MIDGRALSEVARVFLRLGCTSFGGPVAHLAYLRAELVARRRWLDDAAFADLVALCQFLPGPASSQVVFALGMRRAGLAGALVASLCFTLPSAVAMIAFAYGVARVPRLVDAGWLHGLKLASVAVVAQAVGAMGTKLCPDRWRRALCLATAAALLAFPTAWMQVAALAAGALVGFVRGGDIPSNATAEGPSQHVRVGAVALALWAALLVALPVLAASTGHRALAECDAFYRAGSLVFGGGHVVLPLLRAALVPRGWIDDDTFLAGYGAAQAVPGPLFTFAGYLGAAMDHGSARWVGGLRALAAIFLPAWLLVGGALPFWSRWRARRGAQAALAGANASVVGVLLAALWQPVITGAVRSPRDAAFAGVCFGLLGVVEAPSWAVVCGAAAAGVALR